MAIYCPNTSIFGGDLLLYNLSTIVGANLSVAPRIENIPLHITSSLPLDISVPQTLKDKIMSNQFVELSQLLNPTQWDQYNLIMSGGSEAPTLSLQTRRRNKITNVDIWHNAYGIFCYIYLKKYPNDARSLLKYGSLVRGIARSGGDFAGFDERFRYLRQQTLCSWDSVNVENYITSMLN